MASYLPTKDAVIVYIDVDKLRRAGLLEVFAGSKSVEDVEYRKFIEDTGFDYRVDLDRVAISFQPNQRSAIARGKYDWRKINQYLAASGGVCHNMVCDVKPDPLLQRWVSYYPVRPDVLALYSGPAEQGALLVGAARGPIGQWPDAPVWISVPTSVWARAEDLPAGTKTFVSVFAEAQKVVFSANGAPGAASELKLFADIACADEVGAGKLEARLLEATDLLKKMMAREEKTPNPGDLSGLLTGGEFRREGALVKATWPLHRAFLTQLAEGSVK